jgi:EAL domain-containing protein (putative c-di-GMP-specific phosphodiesterase class I)/FixJ family two-component response regulator
MRHPLRLLIVEERQYDAELAANQLRRAGYACSWRCVQTEAQFRAELCRRPDLILADFTLAHYDGFAALELAAHEAPQVPVVFLASDPGERLTLRALERGAADYVPKEDLTRLAPVVARLLAQPAASAPRATDARAARTAPGNRERLLVRRFELALQRQEFSVHYQPLVERVSGQVIAAEALLRWRDPQRGVLAPAAFLHTLERTSLMVPVGEWVLAQAVHDCAQWQQAGLPRLRIAVNVSVPELLRRDFAGYFLEHTRDAADAPGIDIEIQEHALRTAPQQLRRTLKVLRGEGVRIAVDHFGMAPGSLRRLRELPVDSLKIDRGFVSHLTDRPQCLAVVAAIIAVAREYGLHIVAEGVERVEQLRALDDLGCEQSQGYLHSPAIPAAELATLIASRAPAARLQ